MKSKNLMLSLLSTAFLVSCGQNAFLEQKKSSASSSRSSIIKDKNKTKKELTSQTSHSIYTTNIDLGEIEAGVSKIVPILITNDGNQRIDDYRLSPCDVSSFNRLDDGIIEVGSQETLYVSLEVKGIGEFTREAVLYYKSGDFVGEKIIKITGTSVKSMSTKNADIELAVSSQEKIDFGSVPVKSSSIVDIALEKTALNDSAALLTQIRFQNPSEKFSLTKYSTKCFEGIKDKCTLGVVFQPNSDKKESNILIVSYLDANNSEKTIKIKLKGEGLLESKCIEDRVELLLPKKKSDYSPKESSIELPYYETSSQTDKTLYALANDESNKSYSHGDQVIEYVEDGQVVLSYDTSKIKHEVLSTQLAAKMIKSADQGKSFEKTEILCLSNQKLCSGLRFIDSNYSKHINYNYTVVNDIFSQVLVNKRNEQTVSKKKFYTFDETLSFDEMFGKKTQEIYTDIESGAILPIIFADDIKLAKLPYLKVKYRKVIDSQNTCK